ncbi:MAG: tetratricopeptide repeat protein, partial [Bdellovibrionia bacterium]
IWYEFSEAALREGSNAEAETYARNAIKKAETPIERARAQVLLGMNLFGRGDTEGAAEVFQEALEDVPQNIPALFNLSLVHMQNKKYADAERLLRGAIQSGVAEGPVHLAFSEVAIFLDAEAKQTVRVLEAEGYFSEYAKRRDDYRYEIVLAELRMAVYRKDQPRIDEKLQQFLVVNPEIHMRQARTFELSHSRIDGRSLYNWCLEIYSILPKTPVLNGMIALCLFRNGEINEAIKFSSAAADAAPKDVNLGGLYGFLLNYTGQGEKAFAQFEKTKKTGTSKAELLTRASICEKQGNWGCGIENFKKVQAMDPTETAAVEGLARIYYNDRRVEEAKALLKIGLDRYPNLKTLQKVSRDMQ